MNQKFSIFRSHLDLAQLYWEHTIKEGDWVIDATCGNGHDSLVLARLLKKGKLVGLDVQQQAIDNTLARLQANLSEEEMQSIHLFQQSHIQFPLLVYENPVSVIVYNLGYLPGSDKTQTTQTTTTLRSVQTSSNLLKKGGILSITCYPGHEEGAKEQQALIALLSSFDPSIWCVCHHQFLNRTYSPSLLLAQKSL